MGKKKAAVITGDIIQSSALSTAQRKKLQARLQQFFTQARARFPDFKAEQYRGDSVQIQLTRSRAGALQAALLLQTFLHSQSFLIRLGIGIGEIAYSARQVSISDGSAFQLSGPLADDLKKQGSLIAVASVDGDFNGEWQVHGATLSYLLERQSEVQAQALYLQLQGLTQEQIAQKLHISQPSVHQRLQAGGWPVIRQILQRFETTVPAL